MVGVEGDIAYQGNKKNRFSELAGTPIRDVVQINWTAHALVRLGFDVNGWLPYVIGGAVGANVKASHTGLISPTESFTWRQKDFRIAKSYGAGIEHRLGGGWSFRGEYLYDYWSAKHYEWVPGQRYSDVGLTIHSFRLMLTKQLGVPR